MIIIVLPGNQGIEYNPWKPGQNIISLETRAYNIIPGNQGIT